MNKKKCQQKHAKLRFLQRAGRDFSKSMNEEFCKRIQHKDNAKFIHRQSHRITHWDVSEGEKIFRCVYDKLRKQIVTVLWAKEKKKTESTKINKDKKSLENYYEKGYRLWIEKAKGPVNNNETIEELTDGQDGQETVQDKA